MIDPKPFVKWAGGKRRLIPVLTQYLPPDVKKRRHVEPFTGGGALFFHQNPDRALLSELNPSLVSAYKTVRDRIDELVDTLKALSTATSKEDYLRVRSDYNERLGGQVLQTARFIYLNRMCFNGLHRVNKKGHFNVPMGAYKNPRVLHEEVLRSASKALQGVVIELADFEDMLEDIGSDDFVYIDPPYVPASVTENFVSYTSNGFDMKDQMRLASFCSDLDRKGAKFMVSNSNTPPVLHMYKEWNIHHVEGPRSISSKSSSRKPAKEVIVTNYTAV